MMHGSPGDAVSFLPREKTHIIPDRIGEWL
jgi:hypothetical protein